jgi:transposase
MAKPLVPDELWEIVEPLLPPHPPRPKGGRKPVDDRACFAGILFVLKTGIAWEDLPAEMGCGCGMTCWRRLRDWHAAGVFQRLHEVLLAKLRAAGCIDWEHVVVDSSSVRAVFGGRRPGRIPRTGRKREPSTTWSPTPAASRWRRSSPGPTATTSRSCCR